MKIAVISYSLTGNNEALAISIAKELEAEQIKITESKPRTMGSIVLDLIINRIPKVQPSPDRIDNYDLILLFGPIWMGQVATPLRPYLKHLNGGRYAFISISGGADGVNPKIADELKKRAGKEPGALIELHITDLLPSDPKPVRKDTSTYRINKDDIQKLTGTIIKTLRESILN